MLVLRGTTCRHLSLISHSQKTLFESPMLWPTLRPNVWPRLGRMDAQDRFWYALYGGDAIGMFDTRNEKMTYWKVLIKYTTPYTATVPDAKGYVYAPSSTSERLLRLDPKTGEVVEYPMPTRLVTS